jgi:hypothetical protein
MRSWLRSILGMSTAGGKPPDGPMAAADVVAHVPGLT